MTRIIHLLNQSYIMFRLFLFRFQLFVDLQQNFAAKTFSTAPATVNFDPKSLAAPTAYATPTLKLLSSDVDLFLPFSN